MTFPVLETPAAGPPDVQKDPGEAKVEKPTSPPVESSDPHEAPETK